MNYLKHLFYTCLCACTLALPARAQERTGPLDHNPYVRPGGSGSLLKTTALGLPFFEDFSGYDAIPDQTRWQGRQVYVNNTMGVNPISRGVATFDALSEYGKPYDTLNANALYYADSLSSQAFDLSAYVPGDSLYLSFFYQPQGNGFAPDAADSLLLFFRRRGTTNPWVRVWGTVDTALRPFRQVMVPVADTMYLHAGFQFRFVNKASIGINDDVWNLDYIRFDAGRNRYDTAVNDIAFTQTPSPLLGDYQSMPYRQYLADPAKERAAVLKTQIANQFTSAQNLSVYGYEATVRASGSFLSGGSSPGLLIGGRSSVDISFSAYTATVPAAGRYDRVVFDNRFYLAPATVNTVLDNDTVVGSQVFDNYLAYDDGTAEMSYFLNLFPTLPGKIAVEHHLNEDDTLRGVAIYFGRQVPMATFKYFSAIIYRKIAYGSSTSDDIIYQMDNLQPAYRDTVNHYFIYKFDRPVPMPAGSFYMGIMIPAMSGSDNLYFGLDANRKTANHAYYNVLNVWRPSLIEGALMIRPLLGQPVSGTVVSESVLAPGFTLYPDPATDQIRLQVSDRSFVDVQVLDMAGRVLLSVPGLATDSPLDISVLPGGVYLLGVKDDSGGRSFRRFVKQ